MAGCSNRKGEPHWEGASGWCDGSEDGVGWVPLQDGAILEAEDGASRGADDAVVLSELGLDEALGVGSLGR